MEEFPSEMYWTLPNSYKSSHLCTHGCVKSYGTEWEYCEYILYFQGSRMMEVRGSQLIVRGSQLIVRASRLSLLMSHYK